MCGKILNRQRIDAVFHHNFGLILTEDEYVVLNAFVRTQPCLLYYGKISFIENYSCMSKEAPVISAGQHWIDIAKLGQASYFYLIHNCDEWL